MSDEEPKRRRKARPGKWADPKVPKSGWTCVGIHDSGEPGAGYMDGFSAVASTPGYYDAVRGDLSAAGILQFDRVAACANDAALAQAGICQMCEYQPIRYVHEMRHPAFPKSLFTGCVCTGGMEGNLQAAREREKPLRLAAAKRIRDARKEAKVAAEAAAAAERAVAVREWAVRLAAERKAKTAAEAAAVRERAAAARQNWRRTADWRKDGTTYRRRAGAYEVVVELYRGWRFLVRSRHRRASCPGRGEVPFPTAGTAMTAAYDAMNKLQAEDDAWRARRRVDHAAV